MKTLIVDDEPTCLGEILNGWGQCDIATTGIEGLEYVENALKIKAPYELILLDIIIPELNGLDLIKKIRRLELVYNIKSVHESKIVVISTRRDEPSILEAFRNGSTGWINKPIDPVSFVAAIKKLM